MVELVVEIDVVQVIPVGQGMVVKYISVFEVRTYHFLLPLYLANLIIRLTYFRNNNIFNNQLTSKDLTSHATKACNGETSCGFYGTNGYAGDPCRVNKYTTIKFNCIDSESN